jgi:hypothetical protein
MPSNDIKTLSLFTIIQSNAAKVAGLRKTRAQSLTKML